ncbi:hypothetical protein STRDD11_01906 [Streptococcus sp. DD11]|nr:hypothetical protein STRDD11_01906 [Streptococcus sp. DD11]
MFKKWKRTGSTNADSPKLCFVTANKGSGTAIMGVCPGPSSLIIKGV